LGAGSVEHESIGNFGLAEDMWYVLLMAVVTIRQRACLEKHTFEM
jgi:hypothetical protein